MRFVTAFPGCHVDEKSGTFESPSGCAAGAASEILAHRVPLRRREQVGARHAARDQRLEARARAAVGQAIHQRLDVALGVETKVGGEDLRRAPHLPGRAVDLALELGVRLHHVGDAVEELAVRLRLRLVERVDRPRLRHAELAFAHPRVHRAVEVDVVLLHPPPHLGERLLGLQVELAPCPRRLRRLGLDIEPRE